MLCWFMDRREAIWIMAVKSAAGYWLKYGEHRRNFQCGVTSILGEAKDGFALM